MADSDITVVGLQARAGERQIVLNWAIDDPNFERLPYLQFDHVEIWARYTGGVRPTTHLLDFIKIGEAYTAFADTENVGAGYTGIYKLRAIDRSGNAGDFTAEVSATEISGDVSVAENGYWRLPSGLIEQWGRALTDGTTTSVRFPIEFPNGVFSVTATPYHPIEDFHILAIQTANVSTTGFDVRTVDIFCDSYDPDAVPPFPEAHLVGSAANVNWRAVGY